MPTEFNPTRPTARRLDLKRLSALPPVVSLAAGRTVDAPKTLPATPGELLQQRMDDLGVQRTRLAKQLNVHVSIVDGLLNGTLSLRDFEAALTKVLMTPKGYWGGAESSYDSAWEETQHAQAAEAFVAHQAARYPPAGPGSSYVVLSVVPEGIPGLEAGKVVLATVTDLGIQPAQIVSGELLHAKPPPPVAPPQERDPVIQQLAEARAAGRARFSLPYVREAPAAKAQPAAEAPATESTPRMPTPVEVLRSYLDVKNPEADLRSKLGIPLDMARELLSGKGGIPEELAGVMSWRLKNAEGGTENWLSLFGRQEAPAPVPRIPTGPKLQLGPAHDPYAAPETPGERIRASMKAVGVRPEELTHVLPKSMWQGLLQGTLEVTPELAQALAFALKSPEEQPELPGVWLRLQDQLDAWKRGQPGRAVPPALDFNATPRF